MALNYRTIHPNFFLQLMGCCFALIYASTGFSQQWQQYASVRAAEWSEDHLEKARQFAVANKSAAVMIVDHGNVVAAWGYIKHPFKAASIRKSLYDATMGATHKQAPVDVQQSLSQLEIDDIEELSDLEKKATFEQLMCARSGVYHPAAYEARSNAQRRPKRGSAKPDTQWYYNNWDFNVVGSGFSKLAGIKMEQAYVEKIVRPLGMEDFESDHLFECLEPRLSSHPALTIRISARDLARIGKLYLQKGNWEGNSIVPEEWITQSTQAHTTFGKGHYRGEGRAYGRLWWIFPALEQPTSSYARYYRILALGAGGQTMVLIPDLDVLVVHLADTDNGRGVSDRSVEKLMALIIDARTGEPSPDLKLEPVKVKKLSGKSPLPLPSLKSVSPQDRARLKGRYMAGGLGLRLYQHSDRLFAQPIGQPLNDVEVFLSQDGSLQSPIASLKIEPVSNNDKSVDALRLTFRGQTVSLKRVEE